MLAEIVHVADMQLLGHVQGGPEATTHGAWYVDQQGTTLQQGRDTSQQWQMQQVRALC